MDKQTEANINQLAGDVHILTWPIRAAIQMIVILLLTLSLPFVMVGWLVDHAVIGGPVTCDSGAMWIVSRVLIILYPLWSTLFYGLGYHISSFSLDSARNRCITTFAWGWQGIGFLIGIPIWCLAMRLWFAYGWSTGEVLLLLAVFSAIPIAIGCLLRSEKAIVGFLIGCGCLALLVAFAFRNCNSPGEAEFIPTTPCQARAAVNHGQKGSRSTLAPTIFKLQRLTSSFPPLGR